MVDSLDEALQCVSEKVCTSARYVVYNVVEQILFDLLSREIMDETLYKHMANCFDTSDAAENMLKNYYPPRPLRLQTPQSCNVGPA